MSKKQHRIPSLWMFMLNLCFLLFVTVAGATDRYVAVSGNNTTGNGTAASPWATINYAVLQAVDGDVIRIGAGLFTEQVKITKDITLIGQGTGQTKIVSPSSLALSFTFTIGPPPGPISLLRGNFCRKR